MRSIFATLALVAALALGSGALAAPAVATATRAVTATAATPTAATATTGWRASSSCAVGGSPDASQNDGSDVAAVDPDDTPAEDYYGGGYYYDGDVIISGPGY